MGVVREVDVKDTGLDSLALDSHLPVHTTNVYYQWDAGV
jgi:hypothetical protein